MFEWVVTYLVMGALLNVLYFCTIGRSDAVEFLLSAKTTLLKAVEPLGVTFGWVVLWPVGIFLVFYNHWVMQKE